MKSFIYLAYFWIFALQIKYILNFKLEVKNLISRNKMKCTQIGLNYSKFIHLQKILVPNKLETYINYWGRFKILPKISKQIFLSINWVNTSCFSLMFTIKKTQNQTLSSLQNLILERKNLNILFLVFSEHFLNFLSKSIGIMIPNSIEYLFYFWRITILRIFENHQL